MLPDDPVEREYRSLVRKLQAARGFCFVVYFVDDRRASQALQTRLSALLDSQGRRVFAVAAESAPELVARTLQGILGAPKLAAAYAVRPVVWVEAFRSNGDAAWDTQRRLLLMRMNERRSRFESELAAPLILLLPAGGQRDAASLAPDLWHVRLHSAVLSVGRASAAAVGRSMPFVPAASDPLPRPENEAETLPPELAYWNAVHNAALGAAADDPQALRSLSLWDGFHALHALSRERRFDRAVALAEQLVGLARERLDPSPPRDGEPMSLARQELAVALREWGDAQVRAGALDAAIATLDDGIAVARSTGASAGRDPAAIQVLSTLLFSLGDALLQAGRGREATSRFQESLALLRRLPVGPDGAESSVMVTLLGRIGDAARVASDLQAAIGAYCESVALWQHLRESGGDDPALLRSLALALARLGDAEWEDGQGERAMTAYVESLALLNEVLSRSGESEQALSDPGSVLLRIGQAEQLAGRVDEALAAFEKVVPLARRLRDRGADATVLLDDLVLALQRIVTSAAGGPPLEAGSAAIRSAEAAGRLLAEAGDIRAAAK